MLENLLTKIDKKRSKKYLQLLSVPALIVFFFFVAQIILSLIAKLFGNSIDRIAPEIVDTVFAALVYGITILGVYIVHKRLFTKSLLGFNRLPNWLDIGLAPAAFIGYLILTALVMYGVSVFIPGVNLNESQEIGFQNVVSGYPLLLAFITLVVIAPVAEETLFRGYMYGRLKAAKIPVWLVILMVSAVFGAIHGQWNVFFDTFTLSVVLCALREITGNIWASILLHMIKNGLAFYLLFINPSLLSTIGG